MKFILLSFFLFSTLNVLAVVNNSQITVKNVWSCKDTWKYDLVRDQLDTILKINHCEPLLFNKLKANMLSQCQAEFVKINITCPRDLNIVGSTGHINDKYLVVDQQSKSKMTLLFSGWILLQHTISQ